MSRESPASDTEVALLRQQVQMLAEERRREREQMQEQIEDLKATLKSAQEQQTRLTALLTDQRQEKDKKEAQQQTLLLKELRQRQIRLEHELRRRERGFFARWLGGRDRSKKANKPPQPSAHAGP